MTEKPRRTPFEFRQGVKSFVAAFNEIVSAELRRKQAEFLSPDNVFRLNHGRRWRAHASYQPERLSEIESHEHEFALKFDDVLDAKFEKFQQHIEALVKEMHERSLRMMYEIINATCEETGNVVEAKASGSQAEAFIQMLEKIEFGVDRNGQPSNSTNSPPGGRRKIDLSPKSPGAGISAESR